MSVCLAVCLGGIDSNAANTLFKELTVTSVFRGLFPRPFIFFELRLLKAKLSVMLCRDQRVTRPWSGGY